MGDDELRTQSLTSVLRGAGFFGIGKVVASGLGFLINVLLTQGLGAALFGTYTFARTIVVTIGSVSNLGADKAVLRFVSTEGDTRDAHLGLSYLVATVGGLLVGVVLFFAAPLIVEHTADKPLFVPTLRLLSALLVVQALVTITGNGFRAIDRPDLNSLLKQITRRVAMLLAVGLAFLLSAPLLGYVVAAVVAMGMTAVVGLVLLYRRTSLRPTLPGGSVDVRSYLSYSVPLAFKDAGSVLYTRIDILVVGTLLSATAVGYYQVAIVLSFLLTLPITAVNQIFPPVTSRLYQDDEWETISDVYKTAARWILSGTLPAVAGLLVFRTEILRLFGSEFTAAAPLLVLFAVGQTANAFVGPSGYLLMMTDRQFVVTANQWGFGVLNLVLNVVLVQRFGIIGAAAATAGVLVAINVTRVSEIYYFYRTHPFSMAMAKPLGATLVSAAVMLLVHNHFPSLIGLIVGGSAGVLAYLGCLAVFGVEESDRKLISEWQG